MSGSEWLVIEPDRVREVSAVAITRIVTDGLVRWAGLSVNGATRATDVASRGMAARVGLHQRGAAICVAVEAMAGCRSPDAPARRGTLAVGGTGIGSGLHFVLSRVARCAELWRRAV